MSRTNEVEQACRRGASMRGSIADAATLAAEVERPEAHLKGSMQAGGYEHFVEQLRNAQRQAHNAIYVAQQLEKKVDELEALDELTTNQAKEYLARAEAAEARVKELEAVRQDLLGKIVGWQDGHREDQERIAKLRAALKSLQSDAQCTIDLYNKNGPTWTSRDSGAEYYDASYVIGSAEERIATIKAALADTKGTT